MLYLMLAVLAFPVGAFGATATLTWTDNSNNEQNFNIQKKVEACTGTSAFAALVSVGPNVATYVDPVVVEGGTYCYRVNASNTAGASAWSNTAGITIPYTIPPPPSGAAYGPTSLTWTDNSQNETGFTVQRKGEACTGTGAFANLATTAKDIRTYTDGTTVEGGTYCYRVAATNPAGVSAWSNTAERVVPFTVPAPPSGLGAVGAP
jgi:titin